MKIARVGIVLVMAATSVSLTMTQDKRLNESIKINTSLVSVPVIVSDRSGHYISDVFCHRPVTNIGIVSRFLLHYLSLKRGLHPCKYRY